MRNNQTFSKASDAEKKRILADKNDPLHMAALRVTKNGKAFKDIKYSPPKQVQDPKKQLQNAAKPLRAAKTGKFQSSAL